MSDVLNRNWDQYTLLIDGYVRKISVEVSIEIPPEICGIINQFYPKIDVWDKTLIKMDFMSIDDDTNTITSKKPNSGFENVFGKYRVRPNNYIPSNMNEQRDGYHIIYSWKIKLVKIYYGIINIGIVIGSKIKDVLGRMNEPFNYHGEGYGIYLFDKTVCGRITDKHKEITRHRMELKFEQDDIMEIILLFKDNDYENCCIGFTKNGSEIEIAADDLEIDEDYALAIAIYKPGNTIQILD